MKRDLKRVEGTCVVERLACCLIASRLEVTLCNVQNADPRRADSLGGETSPKHDASKICWFSMWAVGSMCTQQGLRPYVFLRLLSFHVSPGGEDDTLGQVHELIELG